MKVWVSLFVMILLGSLGSGCRPPPSEWPAFVPVEVTRSQVGSRRLVLPSAYEAFLRGQLAFNDSDFTQAYRAFQTALRSDPESAYLMTWIALTELSRGRLESSRSSIDRALDQDGCSEFTLCTAASILEVEGDIDGAMRSLQRAIECEPRQPEAYYQLADLLEQQGAQQRAEAIYQDLLQVLPRQARAHRELARLALERDDSEEALRQLSTLLTLEPWRSEAVRQLAELSFSQGDTVSAGSLLRAVVRRDPSDLESRLLLVRVLLAAGNTAAAARHLDALRPDDTDVVRLTELARLYLRARRYERAEEEARRALDRDGSQPIAQYVLVAALRGQGRVELARARAESTPMDCVVADRIYREAALALWDAGLIDEAETLLRQLLDAAPSAYRSRDALARLLESRGQRDQAEALLRAGSTGHDRLSLAAALLEWGRPGEVVETLETLDSVTREERALSYWSFRARALFVLGHSLDEALEMARRAQQLDPLEPEHLALVGGLEVAQGRHEEGLALLDRASRRAPGSARVQTDYALALAQAERCREAQDLAERAMRLSPGDWARSRLGQLISTEECDPAEASGSEME